MRAVLVVMIPRMGKERILDEFRRIYLVLNKEVTKKLVLIARTVDGWVLHPDFAEYKQLEEIVKTIIRVENDTASTRRLSGWTPPRREVWKILLDAWLRREEPLRIQEIADRAECSLPTVGETLSLLEEFGEVIRTRGRAAAFGASPRQSLDEILSTARLTRETIRYMDTSGRGADANHLLSRLQRLAPPHVAVGGVVAARVYCPDFDLNGIPRLDVCVLESDPLDWVQKLDPALRRGDEARASAAPPVLLVHPLGRRRLRSVPWALHRLPLADPAETLLDLYDLGLAEQAEALVQHLRKHGKIDG
jgi:hypothetical protein